MIVDSYQQLLRLLRTPEYDQVVRIEVICEHIKNLPNPLPANLRELHCDCNKLTSLPSLPAGLRELHCDVNQLTSLPSLPFSLQVLFCGRNQLTSLPSLPASLQRLHCYNNQLTSLPSLPVSLEWLYCSDNQLTSLPSLPASLRMLSCDGNRLTSLPSLPSSLQRLHCYNNRLTSLPSLPSGLQGLYRGGNQLPSLDISSWRLSTRIRRKLYLPVIVKLQQRWRQRRQFQVFKEELLAAIYHPDNLRQAQDPCGSPRLARDADASPCGPAKQASQTWMETRSN